MHYLDGDRVGFKEKRLDILKRKISTVNLNMRERERERGGGSMCVYMHSHAYEKKQGVKF